MEEFTTPDIDVFASKDSTKVMVVIWGQADLILDRNVAASLGGKLLALEAELEKEDGPA